MVAYSNSRISRFENCPYSYKLKYIDRIKVDVKTVEILLGRLVHEVLEKLYKDKKFMKDVSKEELVGFFNGLWEKNYSDDVVIVKKGLGAENYRKMGEKFIGDYYDSHAPFDDLTILGLETNDRISLPDGNQWYVRIDKLACDGEGNYYVMDYKTSSRMMTQDDADSDRQLALYSIWVKNKFKDAKSVKLVWHMLAFDKDVVSERTDEEVEELQKEICLKIEEIEGASEFPCKVGGLCGYCEYRGMCPSFRHEAALNEGGGLAVSGEPLAVSSGMDAGDGLKLVDEYSEVKMQLGELKKKKGELEGKLIDYAKEFDVDVICGSDKIAKLKEIDKCLMPEDKEKLIGILKEKGLYDSYSMLCSARLSSHILKGEISDKDICDCVEMVSDVRISLSKRKSEEDG